MIVIAFPQFNPNAPSGSMCAYYSNLLGNLVGLCSQKEIAAAIPENYYKILVNANAGKNTLLPIKGLLKFGNKLGGWLIEYWIFLFLLGLFDANSKVVAISQEYTPPWRTRTSVAIVHDLIQLRFPRSKSAYLFYRFYIPWSLRRLCGVISVSNTTSKQLLDFDINSRVVFNYIEAKWLLLRERRKRPFDYDFIWVGTSAEHKDLKSFLKCAKELPAYKFAVVASSAIEEENNEPISKNIHHFSSVSLGELENLFLTSRVYVSTSLEEGYGRPAMEARLAGLLLVLSDIPVHRELHNDCATYFAPGNSESLLSALKVVGDAEWVPEIGSSRFDGSPLMIAREDELAKAVLQQILTRCQ